MPVDPLLAGLIRGFAAEAATLCQSTTAAVLQLEGAAGDPAARAAAAEVVARGLHTLKGSAATVGLTDVAAMAHALEGRFAAARDGSGALPSAEADALLEGLDGLLSRVKTEAAAVAAQGPAASRPGTTAAPVPAAPVPAAAKAPPQTPDEDRGTWRVEAGQVRQLARQLEPLREAVLRAEHRRLQLEQLLEGSARGSEASREAGLEAFRAALASDRTALGSALQDLEGSVTALSTREVATLQSSLDRVVRDACRKTSKRARLSLVGGELGLPRGLLDALQAPLMHLLRNAVDHGLELPEVREQHGKHPAGELVVRFESYGNQVVVEVADDGAGLDLEAIRARGVQRGLVDASEAARLDTERITALVFLPGFSTRTEVSEVSGRGVGLDVVKRDVEALGGTVQVTSRPGQGSQFLLFLPLDAGSLPVLLVQSAGQRFAVALSRLEAVVAAKASPGGEPQARSADGSALQVDDLGSLLGLGEPAPLQPGQPVLLVRGRSGRRALAVAAVLGDQTVSVRALPPQLRTVPAFQGACALGSGEVALLLRPEWLESAAAPVRTARRTRRALVIDDSLTARALHRLLLEAGGFVVHALPGAAEAMERLRSQPYDVVVADVGLPGMDGIAMTRALRAAPETAGLRVVLVSAREGATWLAQAEQAGADAVLTKQACASGALLAEVERVLAGARS